MTFEEQIKDQIKKFVNTIDKPRRKKKFNYIKDFFLLTTKQGMYIIAINTCETHVKDLMVQGCPFHYSNTNLKTVKEYKEWLCNTIYRAITKDSYLNTHFPEKNSNESSNKSTSN